VISPNPTSDLITIENRNNVPISSVEIIDINGRELKRMDRSLEDKYTSMSIGSYKSGAYFVRINSQNDFLVKQIIKL